MRQRGAEGRRRASVLVKPCLVLATIAATAIAAPVDAHPRHLGDTRVFATIPYPGNPGGLAVDGRTLYVDSSAANFDRPFDGSDSIFEYDARTGRRLTRRPNPIVVARRLPVAPMGLAGIALDAAGRLYVADMNGRIVRVDPRTGAQDVYATFPTNTYTSLTDMPTFLAFTRDGYLYVGDAAGPPIVWRVAPGGGPAQPWFVDPRLAGGWAGGVLGVTVDPSGRYLYFAAGNQAAPGVAIYRLPLAHPDAAHLRVFHRYADVTFTPCDPTSPPMSFANCAGAQLAGAGDITFGRSGKLYVALFAKNELSILRPNGSEQARLPRAGGMMLNGPFDVRFGPRRSLLVSDVGDPSLSYGPGRTPPPGGLPSSKSWAVLDVYVGDAGVPAVRPAIP